MPVDSVADARGRSRPDPAVTPCSVQTDLYLHPLLEEPPVQYTADKDTWRTYQGLVEQARAQCAACPLLVECLYKAVVQSDISGYVGCTTPKERLKIRRRLGLKLESEDLDGAAGARGTRRPVDPDDVARVRAAYPDDSLEALARRLDCSLSTVKRHLRRARSKPEPRQRTQPSVDQVLDAFDHVVEARRSRTA